MMSSTKPEVLNMSRHRQKRTELWPQIKCTQIRWDRLCNFRVMRADSKNNCLAHRHTHAPNRLLCLDHYTSR